ncbi:MAG: methyltransferase domain-containing protein [Verrucomicrobia bacterium]|nr:methyltransferase domain-containing protein [Verrucomicrobiota bacterium]
MGFLTPPRRFETEGTDPANVPARLRVGSLHDQARLNHRFGGVRAVLQPLARMIRATKPRAPIQVLDLGTGPADIPRAIVCWARRQNIPLVVTAVDHDPMTLEVARKECIEFPQISFEQENLLALPYAPRSFDFVICSQRLHHHPDADAARILQRAARIARLGYIATEWRRSRTAHAMLWILARLTTSSPLTRAEAPAAVLHAFTRREFRALAARAGLRDFRIVCMPWFRMTLYGLT